MFTFCDVLHEAKKNLKQTLESAQYRLETSFNILPHQGPSCRLQQHKIGIFRDAVQYFIRNI